MKTFRKELSLFIAAVSISSVAVADFTLTDLGSVTISPSTYVYFGSSNATGGATGDIYSTTTGENHAYYYQSGVGHDIGTLGGSYAFATSMNSSNNIAGYSSIAGDSAYHALYYDGSMHDLGTLGGTDSYANSINSTNSVVGESAIANDAGYHAFLYNGTMQDLGTLGGNYSGAYAINDNNVIVGYSSTTDDAESHAFMYSNGAMNDLGTLGGFYSSAYGISSNGLIVGDSNLVGDENSSHAFLYDGVMHDLGTLGGDYSSAFAVNSLGWVLGNSSTENDAWAYFFYDGTTMHNLDALLNSDTTGIYMGGVLGLNDAGDIFLWVQDVNDEEGLDHIYRLNVSAVPVPASAWLFGSCLTGLVGLRRKLKNT